MTNLNSAPPDDGPSSPAFRVFFQSASGRRCRAMLGEEPALRLLGSVFRACTATLPTLSRIRKHPSRDLCGAEFWAPLSKRLRICAGLCVANLVDRQDLPLRLHRTPSGRGAKTYWIT